MIRTGVFLWASLLFTRSSVIAQLTSQEAAEFLIQAIAHSDNADSYMKVWSTNIANTQWQATEYQKITTDGIVLHRSEVVQLDEKLKPKKIFHH
jgi:hypothetical protein